MKRILLTTLSITLISTIHASLEEAARKHEIEQTRRYGEQFVTEYRTKEREEKERIRKAQQVLAKRGTVEIGKQGQNASRRQNWNFELQNKWEQGFIEVSLFYVNAAEKQREYVFDTPLMPLEKVRTIVDVNQPIFIEIRHNGKPLKTITTFPCQAIDRNVCYRTIYITFGQDGSVYPQTGVFGGILKTTDSGLDNSRNIPQLAITYRSHGR